MVFKCTKYLCMHANFIKCSNYVEIKLNIESTDAVNWEICSSIADNLPKFIYLCLSKDLLNFVGTSHKLHRQYLNTSVLWRCCLSEEETNTLHSLDCKNSMFIDFNRDLIIKLQKDVCSLLEGVIVPCVLLEYAYQKPFCPTSTVPDSVNKDL